MKKKSLKSYLFAIVSIIVVVVLILLPTLIKAGKNKAASQDVSIVNAQAEKTNITTSLSGAGTLSNDSVVSVSVPSGVEVTEFLVADGDNVTEGTALATVDPVSVAAAISEVKESIEKIEDQIEDLDDASTTETIKTTMAGRVKQVNVESGDDVKDSMVDNGAVVVISLDGKMAVDIETDAVKAGYTCTVTVDGVDYDGYVDTVNKGVATITITDDGPAVGAEASISGPNGVVVATGTLYVHSAWNIMSYSGKVSNVYVSENEKVSSGSKIIALESVDTQAKFNMLTAEHRVYEDLLTQLFELNEDATIYAECDGMITGLDESLVANTSSKSSTATIASSDDIVASETTSYVANAAEMVEGLIGTTEIGVISTANAPNGDDTITYTNNVAVVTAVNGDTVSLKFFPQTVNIDDYSNIPDIDTSLMTGNAQNYTLENVPAFKLVNGSWTSVSASDISEGDVMIFAYNETDTSTPLWIVVKEQSSSSTTPDNPDETPGQTPGSNPPGVTPGNAPTDDSGSDVPDQDPDDESGDDSGDTPGELPGDSAEDPGQNPDDESSDDSGDTPTENPGDGEITGETPGETPGEVPGETPGENPGTETPGDLNDIIGQDPSIGNQESGGYNISDLANLQASMNGSGSFGTGMSSSSIDMSALYGDSMNAATQIANALYSTVKTELMDVVPLDKVSVDISVDELDILAVSLNQEATVTLDALTGQSFTGIVTEIDTNGTNNGGNAKYVVTLTIDRTEDMIAGMNASAIIEMSQNDDILAVPVSAIYNEAGHSYVYISMNGDKLGEKVEVETGISDGQYVEIKSGISENDTVYYEVYGNVE